jgi:hypothetical protein
MPKFNVLAKRVDFFDVTVEVDDITQAEDAALEILTQSEDPWEEHGSTCDGFEVTLVEEA